jgi:predicted amidohydrolase YtcJ
MEIIQSKIFVENGKISNLIQSQGSVSINVDGREIVFENAWAYPGFVDSHGHMAGLGFQLNGLRLNESKSAEDCLAIASREDKYRGDWIYATGWNQENWSNVEFPTSKFIDDVYPNIPVYFLRVDGHAVWVNSKALAMAGITRDSIDPVGGIISRDSNGEPDGMLYDNAMDLVSVLLPKYSDDQLYDIILSSVNELAASGLTEIHDMDVYHEFMPIIKRIEEDGRLPIRICAYIRASALDWYDRNRDIINSDMIRICGMKLYADGALGSRSAALTEVYADDWNTSGIIVTPFDELYEQSKKALERGLGVAIHAIGSLGNRLVIQVFKKLFDDNIAKPTDILRMEHAQIINKEDLEVLKQYPIVASVQPIHCLSDAKMARKRLGARCSDSYRWRSLEALGTQVAGGSDFPIESHNPFLGIDAFVRRIPFGEKLSWYPEECLSRKSALESYTSTPRKITGMFEKRGELIPGKQADITILDRNLMTCSEEEIASAKVVAVVCAGKIVYQA